eukprot:CCRYP_007928-RA/>CCRYP_007928-RA protein AED:0.34 eAED:0.02 QI:0/-1/0/1/-1/0/1/0/221
MTMEANSNFTSKPYVTHMGSRVSLPECQNPQANAILERVHQVTSSMLRTAEIDMTPSVEPSNIDKLVTKVAWAIRSTYYTVLKASPGAAIFGWDMLFDIPFLADWNKIGEYRQHQTDQNTEQEKNSSCRDWDYKVGDLVLLRKDGILHKGESRYESDPLTITSVHTNGTIRIQPGTKSERLTIRRVTPFLTTKLKDGLKCQFRNDKNGLSLFKQHLLVTHV